MLVCAQAQLATLNAEVQRYKERNSNSENNVSKLNTELSDAKQVMGAVASCWSCVPWHHIITRSIPCSLKFL